MVAEQCRSAVSSIIDELDPLIMEEMVKAVRSISQEHFLDVPEDDQGLSTFESQAKDARATKVFLNPDEACKMARDRDMFPEIAEKNDDHKKFHEQFGKCLNLGNHGRNHGGYPIDAARTNSGARHRKVRCPSSGSDGRNYRSCAEKGAVH